MNEVMDGQNWPSMKSLQFLFYFMVYGAKTNLGQFGTLIRNGTPSLNWGHKPQNQQYVKNCGWILIAKLYIYPSNI